MVVTFWEPLSEKKVLSESDKIRLSNLHETFKGGNNVCVNKGSYAVFVKLYPDMKKYPKRDYENCWVIMKA